MIITKKSMFTGQWHSMDIPVTQSQIDAWESGTLIQDAMPNVSADHREFLKTGVTPDEWVNTFGSEK
tara:strand:+ start:292 stop:492 length:201 start_codon:yes stop_codon:yes gene_type:complete